MRNAITRRELARRLNLGEKTVSRGLAGHPDVSAHMIELVRAAAAAAGMDLPPLAQPANQHETRPPRAVADHVVAAAGKHLGQFTWDGADWQPTLTGTHDGYEYRLGFYCLPREGATDERP